MKTKTILFVLAFSLPAAAHHGRDFLLVQDATVPPPFTGIFYTNLELATHSGPDEWSIEPGIVYGLGRGFSAGFTASFMDEGEGMDYSSFSPQIQWQINDAKSPLRFSLLAGYQFGQDPGSAGDHHDDEHEEEHDETEPHEHSTHVHGGIHQHGVDAFFGRLIMETDLSENTKLAVNVISVIPDGASAEWGYAIGLRHAFSHELAIGLEALGDFGSDGYQEAAAAVYYSPSHSVTLKFGIGTGLNEESPDLTLHAGALFRF